MPITESSITISFLKKKSSWLIASLLFVFLSIWACCFKVNDRLLRAANHYAPGVFYYNFRVLLRLKLRQPKTMPSKIPIKDLFFRSIPVKRQRYDRKFWLQRTGLWVQCFLLWRREHLSVFCMRNFAKQRLILIGLLLTTLANYR